MPTAAKHAPGSRAHCPADRLSPTGPQIVPADSPPLPVAVPIVRPYQIMKRPPIYSAGSRQARAVREDLTQYPSRRAPPCGPDIAGCIEMPFGIQKIRTWSRTSVGVTTMAADSQPLTKIVAATTGPDWVVPASPYGLRRLLGERSLMPPPPLTVSGHSPRWQRTVRFSGHQYQDGGPPRNGAPAISMNSINIHKGRGIFHISSTSVDLILYKV